MILEPKSFLPRIFIVHNLLTDNEADHLLQIAITMKAKMNKSQVGADTANSEEKLVRTSSHTWLGRDKYNLS